VIRTERDAEALADVRDALARAVDLPAGGDASRRLRNAAYSLWLDAERELARDLAWCHADAMPTVVRDHDGSWAVCCESCGTRVSRDTYEDVCEAWNSVIEAEDEEGSE